MYSYLACSYLADVHHSRKETHKPIAFKTNTPQKYLGTLQFGPQNAFTYLILILILNLAGSSRMPTRAPCKKTLADPPLFEPQRRAASISPDFFAAGLCRRARLACFGAKFKDKAKQLSRKLFFLGLCAAGQNSLRTRTKHDVRSTRKKPQPLRRKSEPFGGAEMTFHYGYRRAELS